MALCAGAALGLLLPGISDAAATAVNPLLGVLIFATFLGIPLGRIGAGVRDARFMLTLVAVNFLLAPAVAWLCTRFIADQPGLLLGALFVLLCPCVDYVMVFTSLAGGDHARLLSAAPVLMAGQALLLPLWVWLFAGEDAVGNIRPGPFVHALVWLILLPLLAAFVTQRLATGDDAGGRLARRCSTGVQTSMVPLMMLTLAAVVTSQISGVAQHLPKLLALIPVYCGFALFMVVLGTLVSKGVGLVTPTARAVVFSGATRNSLVVLPLVLALPGASGTPDSAANDVALAPLAVVSQTLIELVIMVKMIPLLIRARTLSD